MLLYWQQRVGRKNCGPQRQRGQLRAFMAIEIIARRSASVRFPGGASMEIPDDRIDLVRLALDRLAVNMEPAEC